MSVQAALQSVAGQLSRLTLATRGAAPYDPRRGYQRAVRPGLGTQGRQVTVLANHFALSLKAKQAFHYDVSSACQGGREERRGVCVSFVGVGSLCAARPPPGAGNPLHPHCRRLIARSRLLSLDQQPPPHCLEHIHTQPATHTTVQPLAPPEGEGGGGAKGGRGPPRKPKDRERPLSPCCLTRSLLLRFDGAAAAAERAASCYVPPCCLSCAAAASHHTFNTTTHENPPSTPTQTIPISKRSRRRQPPAAAPDGAPRADQARAAGQVGARLGVGLGQVALRADGGVRRRRLGAVRGGGACRRRPARRCGALDCDVIYGCLPLLFVCVAVIGIHTSQHT